MFKKIDKSTDNIPACFTEEQLKSYSAEAHKAEREKQKDQIIYRRLLKEADHFLSRQDKIIQNAVNHAVQYALDSGKNLETISNPFLTFKLTAKLNLFNLYFKEDVGDIAEFCGIPETLYTVKPILSGIDVAEIFVCNFNNSASQILQTFNHAYTDLLISDNPELKRDYTTCAKLQQSFQKIKGRSVDWKQHLFHAAIQKIAQPDTKLLDIAQFPEDMEKASQNWISIQPYNIGEKIGFQFTFEDGGKVTLSEDKVVIDVATERCLTAIGMLAKLQPQKTLFIEAANPIDFLKAYQTLIDYNAPRGLEMTKKYESLKLEMSTIMKIEQGINGWQKRLENIGVMSMNETKNRFNSAKNFLLGL